MHVTILIILLTNHTHCFLFQLKGQVDDCTCNVGTVDYFNNIKIYPRLQSLLTKDYFRFYKVIGIDLIM